MSTKQIARIAFRSFWLIIPLFIFASLHDYFEWKTMLSLQVQLGFGLVICIVSIRQRFRLFSSLIYLAILLLLLMAEYFSPSTDPGTINISVLLTMVYIAVYGLPKFAELHEQQLRANDPQQSFDFTDDPT